MTAILNVCLLISVTCTPLPAKKPMQAIVVLQQTIIQGGITEPVRLHVGMMGINLEGQIDG